MFLVFLSSDPEKSPEFNADLHARDWHMSRDYVTQIPIMARGRKHCMHSFIKNKPEIHWDSYFEIPMLYYFQLLLSEM